MLRIKQFLIALVGLLVCTSCRQKPTSIGMKNMYPWCIVAYDSLERTPTQRIAMLKELGYEKFAYDWRDRHLDDTAEELRLAVKNDIEILSVWLWLNAKRDSVDQLSPANERLFSIVRELELKTTFWVSMSPNFFKEQTDEASLKEALSYIGFIATKAAEIDCKVALYNHTGWFGIIDNQIKLIEALPQYKLSLVYNFHHGHQDIEHFQSVVKRMLPYLSSVNLNGMQQGHKILTIGQGQHEKQMLNALIEAGFEGPWGILGHVEGVDVKNILEQNMEGLKQLQQH